MPKPSPFMVYYFKTKWTDKHGQPSSMIVPCIAQNYDADKGVLTNAHCPYAELARYHGYSAKFTNHRMTEKIRQEFLTELPYDAEKRAEWLKDKIVTDQSGVNNNPPLFK